MLLNIPNSVWNQLISDAEEKLIQENLKKDDAEKIVDLISDLEKIQSYY